MLKRMWVNQPSTLQPYHKLNGVNVLYDDENKEIWTVSGSVIRQKIDPIALSEGWVNNNFLTQVFYEEYPKTCKTCVCWRRGKIGDYFFGFENGKFVVRQSIADNEEFYNDTESCPIGACVCRKIGREYDLNSCKHSGMAIDAFVISPRHDREGTISMVTHESFGCVNWKGD